MGYILFSAKKRVSIEAPYPYWNGIIEYSYDNQKWIKWRGEKIINNTIYMRGINNTNISALRWRDVYICRAWSLRGKNIRCQGNIENLLDYQSVINNVHPKMNESCFGSLFKDCTSLIEAPQLLATELTNDCYWHMFYGCKKLTISPNMSSWVLFKEILNNQHTLVHCPIQQININNKLYDINALKLL